MQGNDGANERRKIDDHQLIVRLDRHRSSKLLDADVGKKIKNVLKVIHDLMVDGQFATAHSTQIRLDTLKTIEKALERRHLDCNALRQRPNAHVFDIPRKNKYD